MPADVDAALEVARSMLQGDGYYIVVESQTEHELRLNIVATPDACEECLVPKEVLTGIIAGTLPQEMAHAAVVLRYPTEAPN